MTPQRVVVSNADLEPGKTIAHTLAAAGMDVSFQLTPGADALVNSYRLEPAAAAAVEDLSLDEYLWSVSTNLTDAFFASQAAAAQMVAEGRPGCIVNVTSVAGVVGLAGQSSFCSSMAALTALTKVLATEWAHHGIRVAAVGAGLSTELLAGLRTLGGASRRAPPASVVAPEAVAEAVRFVLGARASGIAGVPVYVDGGWLSDGYWLPFP
jgi:NAD(P)-dependent dehydrogenase (short-subunit alcohol dehydrogenase family)